MHMLTRSLSVPSALCPSKSAYVKQSDFKLLPYEQPSNFKMLALFGIYRDSYFDRFMSGLLPSASILADPLFSPFMVVEKIEQSQFWL